MSTTSSAFPPNPSPPPGDDDYGGAGAPSSQLAVFRPKPPATRWTVLCTVRALVATAQPRLNAAATAAAPTLALDHVAPLPTRLPAGMVDDAFIVDLRARVNDTSKEHLLTSLKRHANEVRTRLRSGACRVSGRPIPVC